MTTHNKKTAHSTKTEHEAAKPSAPRTRQVHDGGDAVAVAAPAADTKTQTLLIVVLVIAAFFGAYRFAQASGSGAAAGGATNASTAVGSTGGAAAGGGGGGCCGSGGGGAPVAGTAEIAGGVQKISVDLSSGSYNPNVLNLKAGVPAEITFGQSGGCTGVVQSQDLGFQEDLSTGPKTVKIDGLPAGTYGFSCGMGMVTGQIVVQ